MGYKAMGREFSEAIFAAAAFLILAAFSAGVGTISAGIFLYGYTREPLLMVGASLGAAFSIWTGWQAVSTIPFTISLFRKSGRDWRAKRQAAAALDPQGSALRTGLFRLWIVGTVTWLPIGFYLWREGRSFHPLELIGWIVIPPIAVFAFGLAIRWAIAGFRPQEDVKSPPR
jgi:hypothetical protein